ncbi:hypothetical protein [Pedobacter cryoconitis]|uniref:Uncharacterized protein n=1 Tax=Pedobacter cryoconitis TaxID=188932 RepID=A0A7X0J0B2_9SPHI|nr:hypothetical protein [Pedobacter cryoconitis]MBB6498142.1 hypothetical protein [Pedobacter cryoconitis]
MRFTYHYLFFLFIVLITSSGYAQEKKIKLTTDFYNEIGKYNLSEILTADSILAVDQIDGEITERRIKRGEILGFIGDKYQRILIHLISVVKNPKKPGEYLIYGKSKVKENICSFRGTLKILEARLYRNNSIPKYREGLMVSELYLNEEKQQVSAGFFKGKLYSRFVLDDSNKLKYCAINFATDGFLNNAFTGSWTSYKGGASKKCNWGDFRIPGSGDLDIGAGEFSVNSRYLENGWKTYKDAHADLREEGYTEEIIAKAMEKENEQWWK